MTPDNVFIVTKVTGRLWMVEVLCIPYLHTSAKAPGILQAVDTTNAEVRDLRSNTMDLM